MTIIHSKRYKTDTMGLFCTNAAGMGCSVPDIAASVVYRVQDFCDAMQKGGRTVPQPRNSRNDAMARQDWVSTPQNPDSQTKQVKAIKRRLDNLDEATL